MPPKCVNRLPLHTAIERGSAETIRVSIGHGAPRLANRISTTIECASPRVLPEAKIHDEVEGNSGYNNEEEEQPDVNNDGKEQAAHTDRGDFLRSDITRTDMREMLEQQCNLVG